MFADIVQVRSSSAAAAHRSCHGHSCTHAGRRCCCLLTLALTAGACACATPLRSGSGSCRGAEKVPNSRVALRRSLRIPVVKRGSVNLCIAREWCVTRRRMCACAVRSIYSYLACRSVGIRRSKPRCARSGRFARPAGRCNIYAWPKPEGPAGRPRAAACGRGALCAAVDVLRVAPRAQEQQGRLINVKIESGL